MPNGSRDWGLLQNQRLHLCRPFDPDLANDTTGAWNWVGVPQSILLNGKGFFQDCNLLDGNNTSTDIACNVSTLAVPSGRSRLLPWASPSSPGIYAHTPGQLFCM